MSTVREAARHLERLKVHTAVDWHATFRAFDEEHGRCPVFLWGRLTWADGWTHELDHRGPAHPPPSDPRRLAQLQLGYWGRRRTVVRSERAKARAMLESAEQAIASRTSPIIVVTREFDHGTGKWKKTQHKLSAHDKMCLEPLRERLRWCSKDVEIADKRIAELRAVVGETNVVTMGIE